MPTSSLWTTANTSSRYVHRNDVQVADYSGFYQVWEMAGRDGDDLLSMACYNAMLERGLRYWRCYIRDAYLARALQDDEHVLGDIEGLKVISGDVKRPRSDSNCGDGEQTKRLKPSIWQIAIPKSAASSNKTAVTKDEKAGMGNSDSDADGDLSVDESDAEPIHMRWTAEEDAELLLLREWTMPDASWADIVHGYNKRFDKPSRDHSSISAR
jgi:hypothetical protein